jgi:hypothetical protein
MTRAARNRFIALATGGYAVLGLAWVFLSDRLLAAFADIESMPWLATVKGVFFVVATAAALFLALRAVSSTAAGMPQWPLEAPAGRFSPGRLPVWLTHAFAVAATLAMLLVRDRLAVEFGDRPLLILFMFPIILGALLGGLWPGLVATTVAALGLAYLAIPPVHSVRIGAGHDLLQWSFLIANGVAVSLLGEGLRRSLRRLAINRRLLDAFIAGTPDAVFVKDTQGRYLLANAATAGFVGKPVDEIVGRDDRALFRDGSARDLIAKDRMIMAAGGTQTHEERLATLDGKVLVFLVTKGPLFDEAGRVVGLFGISRDITDRKRAEEEIRSLNAELERRAAERSAELQSANLELEDLAYALTHNLRAPLRAIGGFSQVLLEDHAGKLDGDMRACLDQITQASSNLGGLIDGILALLRCTRGELQRGTVDISMLATRRLDELARAEPQRQVTRHVAAGLAVIGDAAMLAIVVTQLLDNAWKFTRDRADAVIRVSAGEVDGLPGICVADNGAGFDMAHAEQLFPPFQRLHRQDEFPGIGIGLATVQRIIHRHGGQINAVAVPGAGATFCFSLPPATATSEDRHD